MAGGVAHYHKLGSVWKKVYLVEEEREGQAEDGTVVEKRKKEAAEKAQVQ